jgi:hypothetical protein
MKPPKKVPDHTPLANENLPDIFLYTVTKTGGPNRTSFVTVPPPVGSIAARSDTSAGTPSPTLTVPTQEIAHRPLPRKNNLNRSREPLAWRLRLKSQTPTNEK